MEIDIITTTIASGQTTSPEVDIGNKVLVGIQVPSNWSAATISFLASIDGGATFGPVVNFAGGTTTPYVSASLGAGQAYLALDPTILRGISSFKIVAGTAQANLVTLSLVTRLVH
jgi:hypothetical protein